MIELDFTPSARTWSPQQDAIFAWFATPDEERPNLVVRARAGCIYGDAKISINRGGKGWTLPLKELVAKFNRVPFVQTFLKSGKQVRQADRPWDKTIPTFVQQEIDGVVRLALVKDAWMSGTKKTFLVTTDTGRTVRATNEHPFLTERGWRRLGELVKGDLVHVRGGQAIGNGRAEKKYYPAPANMWYHPFAVKHSPDSTHRGGTARVPEHRLAAEAVLNNLSYNDYVARVRRGNIQGLVFIDPRTQEVHHKDRDPRNNDPSNLMIMSESEHVRLHAAEGTDKNVLFNIVTESVESVVEYGEEETFDLEVDNEYPHNFIADGFVVHNTGKTTTILEGIDRAPETSIMLCAFNKRIAEELSERISNPNAVAKTLHAIGFAAVRTAWTVRVAEGTKRAWSLTEQVCGQKAPDDAKRLVNSLHTHGREMLPHATTGEELRGLAYDFDCVPTPDFLSTPGFAEYTVDWVCARAIEAMEAAAAVKPVVGIDFADMLYLPLRNGWLRPTYDLVVVDEAQDMSAAQLEMAQRILKIGGRIAVVGDDRQCHPAGTMIEVTGIGKVPIEKISEGDEVVSYHEYFRGIGSQGRSVLATKKELYSGPMLTIHAGDKGVRVTPNHRIPTRVNGKGADHWALYLMEKDGVSRVGCCQLLYGTGFGPTTRARQEDADRLWILKTFDSRIDARVEETLTGLDFGIPERSGLYAKPEAKDAILSRIKPNQDRAAKCLIAYGRSYNFPLYERNNGKHYGRYIYVTEACNLLAGLNEVRTFDGTFNGGSWSEIAVTSEDVVDIPIYSLSVTSTEGGLRLYVADNILVHNSIYSFRGADSNALDRLKNELAAVELPLTTTYRCGSEIVREAQALVPDFNCPEDAPRGQVQSIEGLGTLVAAAGPDDFILSRKNAPLATVAMACIRAGKRVRIEGKDIGAGLKSIVTKLKAQSIPELMERLEVWEQKEVARWMAAEREEKAEAAIDTAATIRVLSEGVVGPQELVARIDGLFGNFGKNMTVCSTIHRAKGLEADQVFVLQDTLYARFGKREEEENLAYVAITRAKKSLVWVEGVK